MNQFIQYPYIVFPFGLAKPALIITVAYVCILVGCVLYGVVKNKMCFTLRSMSKMKCGEQIRFVMLIVGFVVMLGTCIILPFFFNDENAIIRISNIYLQYEPLIFLGSFLFLATSILNKTNQDKQIVASNKILNVLIWISIFTGVLTGQIDYTFWQNIIVIIGTWMLTILFFVVDIKAPKITISKIDQFDMIPYTPVRSALELFPQHKTQAEDIANIIFNSSYEPFSICVSGDWGTGKTSVVNGAIDILKNKEADLYEFIHINALELDNKQAMMHYLFSRIKEILESRGVYVGIDSEFKEFISSSAGALTSNSIGTLIHKKFFNENNDYRFQKEQLEKVLQCALGEGKLIVIVDDIERCDKKIAREYLFLIKEVATMQSCVSIFVTDYNILNELVYKKTDSKLSADFLSKFFNYRINLRNELPEDVFNFYDKYFKESDPAFQSIYELVCMSPGTWYRTIVSGFQQKISNEKNNKKTYHLDENILKKRIEDLEIRLSLFNSLINNYRSVVKFYNVFRNNTAVCHKLLCSFGRTNETKKYMDSRNIGQILYVLSFAEVFLPSEYQRFIERGARYAESPIYDSNEQVSNERALLIELAEGMIYGEYFDYQKPNGYIKHDIRLFIDTFLSNKNHLQQLVNTFSSQEEKWINAIDNSDISQIKANWEDMILMVLQKNPYITTDITNEWRTQTFSKLLTFAEQQLEIGEFTSDRIFAIFGSDMKTHRLFSIGTGMLTTFWKHLHKSGVYEKPSEALVESINRFPYHYAYDCMGPIYQLAHYLIPFGNGNNQTQDLQKYILTSNNEYTQNISLFLDKLANCIPDFTLTKKEWVEKYKEFAEKIAEYLKKNALLEYQDVNIEIEQMIDLTQELTSLDKIFNWIKGAEDNSCTGSPNFEKDTIEQTIQYFESALTASSQNNNRELEQQFLDFFKWLQNTKELPIDNQQLERLHKLVTQYVELTGYSSFPYRRLLLSIAANQNSSNQTS